MIRGTVSKKPSAMKVFGLPSVHMNNMSLPLLFFRFAISFSSIGYMCIIGINSLFIQKFGLLFVVCNLFRF